METPERVKKLQNIVGYEFRNVGLAETAIVHPGIKKSRSNRDNSDFERLEFLGDRVLGLALASFLYKRYPEDSEGDLAIRIAILAGTDFLIRLAKKTEIIASFSLPKDFFASTNRNSSSIADMFEAVLGAIFLDSNFETVDEIIIKLWENDIDVAILNAKDSKSRLQEVVQAKTPKLPVYRLIEMTGEVHDPIFKMEVNACGKSAIGHGISKKNAEHDAAARLLEKLEKMN
jgi:ribonuclease-3